jgi:hypothetical protein
MVPGVSHYLPVLYRSVPITARNRGALLYCLTVDSLSEGLGRLGYRQQGDSNATNGVTRVGYLCSIDVLVACSQTFRTGLRAHEVVGNDFGFRCIFR